MPLVTGGELVLFAQAAASLVLTGVALLVQIVVYPGLITVGEVVPAAWKTVHAAHSRRITYAVGPAWLVQGVTCALLPFLRPTGVPGWQPLLAGALGLATVGLTVGWAVPLHTRLAPSYDDRLARALLPANLTRLLAWAAAGALALAMLAECR